jgi:thiosulfate reductase cytochrome b subunit
VNPRHSALVRVTHWVHTLSFFALLVSGAAILIAHPRLYWGETGAAGSPAWLELPLPLNMDQSGWGRSLHFLGAWVCVLNGVVYAASGLLRRHFSSGMHQAYSVLQRLAYRGVVFVLFPAIAVTGLAMSPAVGAAMPGIVGTLGGHQSARTIHFFAANLLVVFLIGHVIMVSLAGFSVKMRAMIVREPA